MDAVEEVDGVGAARRLAAALMEAADEIDKLGPGED